ncbi:LON-1 protein [Meloidogyne graminicola]|uniref:LON-1 protein n=1 Tax=Meloidogyne graminicola TaxID=189291 RepID=A0A8S9ZQQ9_9BILA|nr:LON-1 protein [Meloidogyne graminicola]
MNFLNFLFFLYLFLLILNVLAIQQINYPFSEAVISHNGPLNDRINEPPGYETNVPEIELSKIDNIFRNKRSSYGGYYNWKSPALMSSIPPDYNKQLWIISEHNRYRRMVPAKNMRMVYWSNELARSAQAHADTCDFHHSRNRMIKKNFYSIRAAPYYDYSDAIQRWYIEINNPWCACSTGYKHCCGHYIQMVWAETNLIGCGYAQCNGVNGVGAYARAVFVCHYNPQGNRVMPLSSGSLYSYPAYISASRDSERCSECPEDQPSCYDGLCYMPSNYRRPITKTTTEKITTTTTTTNTPKTTKRKHWYKTETTTKTPMKTTTSKYSNYYKQQTLAPRIYPSWEAYLKQQALERQLKGNKVDNRRRKI